MTEQIKKEIEEIRGKLNYMSGLTEEEMQTHQDRLRRLEDQLLGYQKAQSDILEKIDERIKNYQEIHKKFPKDTEFLAKWEAMVELKKSIQEEGE